jgi:antitoxin component YwqK of YwqJK toxin-antitoxin module
MFTQKRVKIAKGYYTSGALRRKTPYVNGKRHGIEKQYYESGILVSEIPFNRGNKCGISRDYYKSGALENEFSYLNSENYDFVIMRYYESGILAKKTLHMDGNEYVGDTFLYDKNIFFNKDGTIS